METNRPNQNPDFGSTKQNHNTNQPSGDKPKDSTISIVDRLRSTNDRGHGRGSNVRLNEALAAAIELTTERQKTMGNDYRMKVLPISGPEVGLAVSALVIHETMDIAGRKDSLMTPFFILLLDGTHDETMRERAKVNGEYYERKATISDFMQGPTRDRAMEQVTKYVKNPGRLIYSGAAYLPKDILLGAENNVNIDPYLGTARNAILSRMAMALGGSLPGEEKFTVDGFDVKTLKALVTVDYNKPKTNQFGRPVRSDISLRLSLQDRNEQKSNTINVSSNAQTVCEVNGFVEPLYAPSNGMGNGAFGNTMPNGQQGQMFYYRPRFVMSHSESQLGSNTMEIKLLEITMMATLRKNMTWVRTWEPKNRRTVNGIDMRDPGALTMLLNDPATGKPLPRVADTTADKYDPQALMGYLSTIMSPDLILSMDVEECGPEYWLDGLFAMAAQEQDRNGPAHKLIISHADVLFNGHFSKVIAGIPNFRIAVPDNTRYSSGYYIDSSNNTARDLAEIDTMAILNFVGDKDVNKAREFAYTQLQGHSDDHMRLVRRREIIEELAPGAEITGIRRRLNLTPMLMNALTAAANACGLLFDMDDDDRIGYGFAQNTAYLDQLGQTYDPNAMFNNSYAGGNNAGFGVDLGVTGFF